MKNKRRDFLKLTGLTGLTVAGGGVLKGLAAESGNINTGAARPYAQQFNMCGYAAPKLDIVRIGFIGLGNRGRLILDRLVYWKESR
ncbi:MAG: twin-arginine translocation signal domain-containing protein [Chitinophagaceae bacterium]